MSNINIQYIYTYFILYITFTVIDGLSKCNSSTEVKVKTENLVMLHLRTVTVLEQANEYDQNTQFVDAKLQLNLKQYACTAHGANMSTTFTHRTKQA